MFLSFAAELSQSFVALVLIGLKLSLRRWWLMMSPMMMPRSEIKSAKAYDQEWDPTVPNGYEMFDVSSIPSCLGSHADKLHTQKVFHLKLLKHFIVILHSK